MDFEFIRCPSEKICDSRGECVHPERSCFQKNGKTLYRVNRKLPPDDPKKKDPLNERKNA